MEIYQGHDVSRIQRLRAVDNHGWTTTPLTRHIMSIYFNPVAFVLCHVSFLYDQPVGTTAGYPSTLQRGVKCTSVTLSVPTHFTAYTGGSDNRKRNGKIHIETVLLSQINIIYTMLGVNITRQEVIITVRKYTVRLFYCLRPT